MALIFNLSRHLVRDVLADELSPPVRHSLWLSLCQAVLRADHPCTRPALPEHHQQNLHRYLLEKSACQC